MNKQLLSLTLSVLSALCIAQGTGTAYGKCPNNRCGTQKPNKPTKATQKKAGPKKPAAKKAAPKKKPAPKKPAPKKPAPKKAAPKKKPAPKKPAQPKPAPSLDHEQKVQALFKRFVDANDKISWKCFAQNLADTMRPNDRYAQLVKELLTLKHSTNPREIGMGLAEYESALPASTKNMFKQYKPADLLKAIKARIALNNTPSGNC